MERLILEKKVLPMVEDPKVGMNSQNPPSTGYIFRKGIIQEEVYNNNTIVWLHSRRELVFPCIVFVHFLADLMHAAHCGMGASWML